MPGTTSVKMNGKRLGFVRQAHGGLTLPLVSGTPSILQRLTIRLMTQLGEDNLHTECGLPRRSMVGVYNHDYIRGSVVRCLLEDPEVASVGNVDVSLDRSTPQVRIAVIQAIVALKSGQTITIATPANAGVFI